MIISAICVISRCVILVGSCIAASKSDRWMDAKNHWHQCRKCRRWYNSIGEIRWFQEDGFDKRNQGACPECTGEFHKN